MGLGAEAEREKGGVAMAQIGEPQRIIIAEPVFEPVPEKQPQEQPQAVPEPEEVPAE